jgi:acetolactate synthase-1/2/3 large subunit
VVLALPEDVLAERVAVPDVTPYTPSRPVATDAAAVEMRQQLERAQRPLVIVGGGDWDAQGSRDLQRFAEAHQVPVVASFRCQDFLDNRHPLYAGDLGLGPNPALADRVKAADFLLLAGARLGEASSRNYTLVDSPNPRQTLVHVYPDSAELGRVYRPHQAVVASAPSFFAAAARLPAVTSPPWQPWTRETRAIYEKWITPITSPGPMQLSQVVASLRTLLPEDAIVTNGAGNYTVWLHRFYQYRRFRTQLGPTSGSMGYGLPAAVSASLLYPERPVVCFAGDGCFLMQGQELATAAQYGARPIVIVVNNGSLGTIRAHQERRYPGRVSATDLANPDFVGLARAYGAHGERIASADEFAPAFERARASGRAALIEIPLDVEVLTPAMTVTQIRAAAQSQRSRQGG